MDSTLRGAFSVLVNFSPTSFFSSSCGLRQGDLLSPILFIAVMETLCMMLATVVNRGLLLVFLVSHSTLMSCKFHIFYNRMILGIYVRLTQITSATSNFFLNVLELSSLKINLIKSELVPMGMLNIHMARLSFLGLEWRPYQCKARDCL